MEQNSSVIIVKVTYGVTIGNQQFGNSRPGVVEATLKPGRTLEEALDELDDRLNAWHRKKYPHLYEQRDPPLSYFATVEHKPVGASLTKKQQDEEADAQLKIAIESLGKIQYKEDAEAFMGTEMWMKYNKIIKSIVNGKPPHP